MSEACKRAKITPSASFLAKKMSSTLTCYTDDRRMAGRLVAACWAATLSGFMALQIYKALRKPMSMIDDGYFALIARSVAEKLEYGLPISSDAKNMFDPTIGAGPALILPGAAAIKLFGAHAWVPAFVVIFLFETLLLAMTVALCREYSPPRAMLFVTIGLVGLVAVTPAHLDLYYVFYGEALQLGFLLLGCILLAQVNNGSIIRSALAGTAFGLAILSKQSSLYCIAGATIAWATFLLFRNPRRMWYAVASYVVTLSIVVLSFEAAKLFVMGWKGYADNLAEILAVVGYFHSQPLDPWARAMAVVKFKYFIDLPMAVFIGLAAVMAYFIAIRMNDALPVILLAAASMHGIYWSFFSLFWDRHLWPGMALVVFTACSVLLLLRPLAAALFLAAFFVLFARPDVLDRALRSQLADTDGRYLAERQAVLSLLNEHRDIEVRGPSWQPFFTIAYELPSGRKWQSRPTSGTSAGTFLLAENLRWSLRSQKANDLLKKCEPLMPSGSIYFAVYRCAL